MFCATVVVNGIPDTQAGSAGHGLRRTDQTGQQRAVIGIGDV